MSVHILLLVVRRAGEVALRAKGHPAVIIASGIAVGFATVARTFSKYKGGSHGDVKTKNHQA